MKLSIIIPVYNSEKYLQTCLESVFRQDMPLREYEVIVINDGSKDESKKIILDFKDQFENLVFIDQPNHGVSAARNAGLEIAKGHYITFIDSDDEIYENTLLKMYNYAVINSLDLLYGKIDYINAESEKTGEFKMISESGEVSDGFTHQRRGVIISFYKKIILNNIRFNTLIPIAEDALFNLEVHTIARRCSYLHHNYYKYRRNINSTTETTMSRSLKAFEGYLEQMRCIKKIVDSNEGSFTDRQIKYFDRPYYKTVETALVTNIIPTFSLSRLAKIKKEMRILNIEHIGKTVDKDYPYFSLSAAFFFLVNGSKWSVYLLKSSIHRMMYIIKK